MSIHPSLNFSEKDKKQRSVLKRIERLKHMIGKNEWKEGDKIYGLPKIKSVRIKIKKEKVEKAAETTVGATAAPEVPVKEAPGKTAAKTEKK